MTNLLDIFGKSPFQGLLDHGTKVMECTQYLKPLFAALFDNDEEQVKEISKVIQQLESEADTLKLEIRRSLPRGIFIPVNREDLLRYLKLQDNIADTVEDITVLISLKKLQSPPELAIETLKYVDVVLEVCNLQAGMIQQFSLLIKSGFKGEEIKKVLLIADEMGLAERKADHAGHNIARKLFLVEDQMKPSDLILWFRIFKLLGNLADHAESTGERLRYILSR